jgi:hypothetical protein
MITNRLFSLIWLLTLAASCVGAALIDRHEHDDDGHDGHNVCFVSFPKFLETVQHAKFEDYKNTYVKSKKAFQEMKTHILSMYDGVTLEKVTSFVLEREHGDCIAIEEQPTMRKHGIKHTERRPPHLTSGNRTSTEGGHGPGKFEYAESPLKLGLKDQFGNAISCPKHAIPMARLTLEKLTRFRTLSDFFAKSPGKLEHHSKRGSEGPHLHAYGSQKVDNFGGNSWLNIWNPKGDFSLSQQWYLGGGGAQLQSVEGGWQVYPAHYHTDKAVLFIYRTVQDYAPNTGCYNLECSGFVQINHNWYLGGIWDHYSETNGPQWGFEMQWRLFNGNWWLFLKGPGDYEAVGYYPTSIFNGGPMSKKATLFEAGGEIIRDTVLDHSWAPMGSGAPASKGYDVAAFQNQAYYIPPDENVRVGVWANFESHVEGPSCYSIDITNAPSAGSWGTYFFFGGPGGNKCT